MRRLIAAGALACLASSAAPQPIVGGIAQPATQPEGCSVYRQGATSEQRLLILHWSGSTAEMHIDRRRVLLTASEAPCRRHCVAPGRRAARVFHFRSGGMQVRLRKAVACSRDAESCGGLAEGPAVLRVSAPSGTAVLSVHNAYCDL